MPDDTSPQEHALASADEAHQWQQRAAALAREGVTQRERLRALEGQVAERDAALHALVDDDVIYMKYGEDPACPYCESVDWGPTGDSIIHTPECPIKQGRELLGMKGDA